MRFEIQTMDDNPIEAIERGFVDLLLTIDYAISADHPSVILFDDDYVVVGDRNNPAMHEPMSLELYFRLGHVSARFGKSRVPAFEDWFVRRRKQRRQVEVVAPSFLSLPGLIVGTNRIATMHRRMAEIVVQSKPLVMREVPFPIPPIREAVQWNIANSNDRALRWVVERLQAVATRTEPAINNDDGTLPSAIGIDRSAIEAEYRMHHPQR
jgi:LysR family nod box-dependent transcriptional activator